MAANSLILITSPALAPVPATNDLVRMQEAVDSPSNRIVHQSFAFAGERVRMKRGRFSPWGSLMLDDGMKDFGDVFGEKFINFAPTIPVLTEPLRSRLDLQRSPTGRREAVTGHSKFQRNALEWLSDFERRTNKSIYRFRGIGQRVGIVHSTPNIELN